MNASIAPEGPRPYDYVGLGLFVMPTLLIIGVGTVMVVAFARHYAPLRARQVPNIVFMSLAAVCHIVGTMFVAFQHVWPHVYNVAPLVWTPWLEYFFGLGMWVVWLELRLLAYGYMFERSLKRLSRTKKRVFRITAFLLLLLPPLSIALVGTFRPLLEDRFAHHANGTVTAVVGGYFARPTWYTYVLAAWLLLCAIQVIVLSVVLRVRRYRRVGDSGAGDSTFDEARVMARITIVSGLVLLVTTLLRALVVFQESSVVRTTVVIAIALMHLHAFLYSVAPTLWRAMRNDRVYARRWTERWVAPQSVVRHDDAANITSAPQLACSKFMIALFFLYVEQQPPPMLGAAPRRWQRVVACYRAAARRLIAPPAEWQTRATAIIGAYITTTPAAWSVVPEDAGDADTDEYAPAINQVSLHASRPWQTLADVDKTDRYLFDNVRAKLLADLFYEFWDQFVQVYGDWYAQWTDDRKLEVEAMRYEGLVDPFGATDDDLSDHDALLVPVRDEDLSDTESVDSLTASDSSYHIGNDSEPVRQSQVDFYEFARALVFASRVRARAAPTDWAHIEDE